MRHASITLGAALLSVWAAAAYATPRAQREFDLVLQRKPNPERGAEIYETCAACHGADGSGTVDGSVPAVGGQAFTVLAKQLVDFRAGARGDERMAHFSGVRHLAYSQHIADVAAYISASLPAREWQVVRDERSARGAVLYANLCERCHGPVAEGDEDTLMPRLAGQRHAYIVSQLAGQTARRPAMRQAHRKLQTRLTDEDVQALATYLSGDPPTSQLETGDSP